MSIQLDHAIVPSRDRRAAAQLLARILGVRWSETGIGPFCPVYVNDELTLDMDQAEGDFPIIVYWSQPDGHVWEALTISYARQPESDAASGA